MKINILKKVLISLRASIKFVIIVCVALLLIIGIVSMAYKPVYEVDVKGEFLGYINNKSSFQEKINKYIDGEGDNVAFVQIDSLPEYKLCLLKKDFEIDEEQIFKKITR